MKRVSLKNISLLFIVMTIILSVIATPAMAAVSTGSVTRSFSTTTPANGSTIIVTLTPGGVVATGDFYGVVETLPAGFTYVSTTATDVVQTGQVLDFTKIGATAFTYTVTAPAAAPGAYSFTGTFVDADTNTGVVATSVVTVGGTASATAPRIWSYIYSNGASPASPFVWNALNFEGFYYDIKYDRSTETLTIKADDSPANLQADRLIQKNKLVYETGQAPVEFKVYEKESTFNAAGTVTDPVKVDQDATYGVVGWQAEKWIAVKGVTNKIAKLTLEMGKDDKKTLTTGETWALGAGYELNINAIDARTTPRQVWFTLKKDGAVIDEGIGQAPTENTGVAKSKAVYYKKKTILGESDALLFTVYVSSIFSGATSDMVQFKYAWLIDETTAKEIKSDDQYGVFKVRSLTPKIVMDNENTVSLSKNSETTLMGNMKFSIADNNTLRFYPFVEHLTAGTYETRGTVVQESTVGAPKWDSYNWAGFYYDIKYDRTTETLQLTNPVSSYTGRTIAKNELKYTTGQAPVEFKVYEKESTFNAAGTVTDPVKVDQDATYGVVGWQAEKWVAVKGVTNKIAKLTLEMGKDDKKTLTTGETWALGAGYELNINAIDARTTPRQVWFTLKKDGAVVDEGIGQAPTENTGVAKSKAVYYKKKTILGESDALLFTVYVSSIFSGATSDMVQFKYAWLIDETTAKEIKSDDQYGVFKVRSLTPNIVMDNENTVSLSKNSETTLMGNMKFRIADNNTLRFYPYVEYTIGEPTDVTATGTAKATGTVKATAAPTKTLTVVPTVTAGEVKPTGTEGKPVATTTPTEPGFGIITAIAGLFAVAYLVLRQRK